MREFNFGQPDELQASQLEDQRRMLAGLMAQSSQGPAFSGKAAAAKALTQVLAQMDMSNASKQQMALAEKRQAEEKAEMEAILGAAQTGGRGDLARLLVQSRNPEMRAAGLRTALEKPKEDEPYILPEGARRYKGSTLVAENPKEAKPDGPKRGEVRRFTRGGEEISETWNGEKWEELGRGPRWQPERPEKPDQTLIEVQDPNNPQRTILIPRSQAAGKAGAGSVGAATREREDLDSLRKEYDAQPMVKAYKDVVPIIESAKKAADTPQGDLSLVYAVGKVLDPNSVVREGEMTLVIKSGSLLERLIGAGRKNFAGGGAITPDMRAKLLGMLEQRAAEYKVGAEKERERIGGIAKQRGYDPTQIFGAPANGPKAGDIVDGFRFKGGDPNNQANWSPA